MTNRCNEYQNQKNTNEWGEVVKDTKFVLEMIENSNNPSQASEIAIKVILDFLKQPQLNLQQVPDPYQVQGEIAL